MTGVNLFSTSRDLLVGFDKFGHRRIKAGRRDDRANLALQSQTLSPMMTHLLDDPNSSTNCLGFIYKHIVERPGTTAIGSDK